MSAIVVLTLNLNAPVFDLVGFCEVEDFSPKWWELVATSKRFRYFLLSANSEYEFEFDAGEEFFSDIEEEFEELIRSSNETELDGSMANTITDVARYLKVLMNRAYSSKRKLYSLNVMISSCSSKYNEKMFKNPDFNCRRNHNIYRPR